MRRTDRGRDLILRRTFEAGIDDVWASVTESDRTALWFGSWTGEAGTGRTVELRMDFEEGAPPADLVIEECEPPRRLKISMVDSHGSWLLAIDLSEQNGETTLELTHHLDQEADVGSTGPGWEYYLDMLVASRNAAEMPDFDDYYPAQKTYYEATPEID